MTQLGLDIQPTIAMRKGVAWVDQCARCGILAAVPGGTDDLGPCPACGEDTWLKQALPVGPFRSVKS